MEAETFRTTGKGLQVIDSVGGGRFDRFFASGGKALAADKKGTGTSQLLFSSQGGDYRVWVRASTPPLDAAAPLKLSIVQAGKQVAQTELAPNRRTPKGRRKVAVWSFEWVPLDVSLDPGDVELSVQKTDPRLLQQRVDCMIVTRDKSYTPDYRDFATQLFMRAHYYDGDHPTLQLRNAHTDERKRRGEIMAPLAKGATSPWLNITSFFTGGTDAVYNIDAKGSWQSADYGLDFATSPTENSILRTLRRSGSGVTLTLLIPGNGNHLGKPIADFEIAERHLAELHKLPPIGFGRRPTRFPIITDLAAEARLRALEYPIMQYIGVNGTNGLLSSDDLAAGLTTSRLYNSALYVGEHGFLDPLSERLRRDFTRHAKVVQQSPTRDRVKHINLADEAQAQSLETMAADPVQQKSFRDWVKREGLTTFGPDELTTLRAAGQDPASALQITADRETSLPSLYYLSQRFRAYSIASYFRGATELAREIYGPGVGTTQNMSDGAVYAANLYYQGNDYFEYFQKRSLDVALSEDWSNAAATREVCGWNAALLRAATRDQGLPVHMYLVAHSQRRPLEVKLKASSELAQGVKLLNLYRFSPAYAALERGWAENPLMYVALAELAHEVGAAEEVLLEAQPRTAETAILYSVPADIWGVGYDLARGFERMYTFLALRHAQIPIDVVSDNQAKQSALKSYKVVYLFDEQVPDAVLRQLAAWVQGGGTLVVGPAAGSRDERNRDSKLLDTLLSLPRGAVSSLQRFGFGARGLRDAKAGGSVTLEPGGKLELIGATQQLTMAAGAQQLASFEGGAPAALELRRGKGRVIVEGFLPALAYMRAAVLAYSTERDEEIAVPGSLGVAIAALSRQSGAGTVRMPRALLQGQIPFSYPAAVRDFITLAVRAAGVQRPVSVDPPQVEATWLEGPGGWVIPLANYTGSPLQRVRLSFNAPGPHGPIHSSRLGALTTERLPDGRETLVLPLESTDFVFAIGK